MSDERRQLIAEAVLFAGAFVGWGVVGALVLRYVILTHIDLSGWAEGLAVAIAGFCGGALAWLVWAVSIFSLALRWYGDPQRSKGPTG